MKKGDILMWDVDSKYHTTKKGAKAVAISDVNPNGIILVKWLDETKHLSKEQKDGGYFEEDFIVVQSK
jgi:hypothetical protein